MPKVCQESDSFNNEEKLSDVIKIKVFDPEKYIKMNEKVKHDSLDIFTPEQENK